MIVTKYDPPRFRGLNAGVRGLGSGASTVGAVGGAVGTVGGGITSILATTGVIAAAAGPIGLAVGAVVAAGAAIVSALGIGNGCGQSCVEATNVVNQAEPTFQQNVIAYENGEIDQATAQANWNAMWGAIQQACGGIPGDGGQQCIADRQQGACTWKASATPYPGASQIYPGQPAAGQCWNWYNGYYTPLTLPPVNAPAVSTSSVGGTVSSTVSGAISDVTSLLPNLSTTDWLLLAGAAALVAVAG